MKHYTDQTRMPFGKHRGKPMKDVPAEYLLWLLGENIPRGKEGPDRKALLDYCGLDFDERCLRFFENDRPVRTASSEQVRQPIYRDGVDQWRHFEPWLEPLANALGPALQHYPAPPPGVPQP